MVDVWAIFSAVVSLDTRSLALSMKERLVSQKGISDCGLLWQSTEGIGLNDVLRNFSGSGTSICRAETAEKMLQQMSAVHARSFIVAKLGFVLNLASQSRGLLSRASTIFRGRSQIRYVVGKDGHY